MTLPIKEYVLLVVLFICSVYVVLILLYCIILYYKGTSPSAQAADEANEGGRNFTTRKRNFSAGKKETTQ